MVHSYLERTQQTLVDAHHSTSIIKLSTVVGSAEEGHELALREEFVAIFNDLMRSANEIHVVLLKEARNDIRSECE